MSAKDIIMSAGSSAAASTPAWINKLVGSSADIANAVAVDASGNVYITGQTQTGTEYDLILAKYTSAGTLVWQVKLAAASVSEQGYCIAVDSSANIYVGGTGSTSTGGALLVKYDTNGAVVWQRRYDTGAGSCTIFGITVDSNGNVFTTGSIWITFGFNTGYAGFVGKYNSSGVIQWQKVLYNNVNGNALHLRAICLDTSGNIYVAGEINDNFITAKLNSSGTIQWKRTINIDTQDVFKGITADSAGNCYIIGNTNTTNFNIVFAKYNTSGTIQWVKFLNAGTSSEYGNAITIDSIDNIYITGISATSTTVTSQNVYIAKYSTAGVMQWQRTLANSTGSTDVGYGIYASLTSVYLTGIITQTNSDIFVASLPADGTKTSTYVLGTTSMTYASASLSESTPTYTEANATNVTSISYGFGLVAGNGVAGTGFTDITSDSSGNTYVVANIGQATGQSIYIGKYTNAGSLVFGKILSFSTASDYIRAIELKLDSAGNIIMLVMNGSTATTSLVKLNPSATAFIWIRNINKGVYALYRHLTIDSSDNIYLALQNTNIIFKYNSSGTLQWQKQPGNTKTNSIANDAAGNIYVVGGTFYSANYVPYIMKLDPSGTILWQRYHTALTPYEAYNIALDSSGNIYICGYGGNGSVFFVAKYTSAGGITWVGTGGVNTFSIECSNIVIDLSNNVWVSGTYRPTSSTKDLFVLQFSDAGANKYTKAIGVTGTNENHTGSTIDSDGVFKIIADPNFTQGTIYSINEALVNQTQVIGGTSVVISNLSSGLSLTTSFNPSPSAITLANTTAVDSAGSGFSVADYSFPTIGFTSGFGAPNSTATSIAAGTTALTSTTVTI